ncbi:MAG: multicopper oxidase domain-containing protein [Proteobacteria bacterium]|nr:multicopper oxidase domain-containing protein [Pseudomonadota bacterium]
MRTFTYLGPNIVSVSALMSGNSIMADGQSLFTWYFADAQNNGFNGDRFVPSPVIEAVEGELVQISLSSILAHSIHLHGLDVDQANDGVPSTSGFVANIEFSGFGRVDGYTNLNSPFVYQFTAPQAGTYMYHCHVDAVLHVERGMYGTIIVRPPDGNTSTAWAGGPDFDREYVWHLHTFDSTWHVGDEQSGAQHARYRPDYFMLNGSDGGVALDDPTCALITAYGEKILIRANNVGYQPAVIDLGGMSFEVIASDGRPLPAPLNVIEQLIAPGERYDLLVTMPQGYDQLATISYLDTRLKNILGTVQTIIRDDAIFTDGFDQGV